ncbi:polyvinylalcohol dehydrogenase, partial [bacterium]|nr:polyvinylalcohol dehydrogenase [bacterium]
MQPVPRRAVAVALLAALLAALAASSSRATDWPTFRGAGRTGVAPDTDLLESWPADGPPLVWAAAGAGR